MIRGRYRVPHMGYQGGRGEGIGGHKRYASPIPSPCPNIDIYAHGYRGDVKDPRYYIIYPKYPLYNPLAPSRYRSLSLHIKGGYP